MTDVDDDMNRLLLVPMTVDEAMSLFGEYLDAEQAGHPWCEGCAAVAVRIADKANEPYAKLYTLRLADGSTITSTLPVTYAEPAS